MSALTAARPGPGAALRAGAGGPLAAMGSERPRRGYASGKADYLSRLRKIEGQVRGLQKMVEADTYCPDVVVQVASVPGPCRRSRSGCSPATCTTAWWTRHAPPRTTARPAWARWPARSARSSASKT